MSYKKLLTVQDISCVGQCSLTVALPILSAAGHETCILPSAVLSTHTAGFTGFTFRDLTEDMPAIMDDAAKQYASQTSQLVRYMERTSTLLEDAVRYMNAGRGGGQ